MHANTIEQEILIDAPATVVWGVVTEPEQINQWFSDSCGFDLRPGGQGTLVFADKATKEPATVQIRVEEVDPQRLFSYRWLYPQDVVPQAGNSMLVEFILAQEGERTRLRVCESGLAELDWSGEQKAGYYDDHAKGWADHMARLLEHVTTRQGARVS